MDANVSERISLRFLRHIVASPEGRAYLLTQVADAEAWPLTKTDPPLLTETDPPS